MQALKNIIVTGSNKGIGQGIASQLASVQGWNVIMACRNTQLGQQSKAEILSKHPNASVHLQKLDISDSKSIDSFVDVVKQKYNPVTVLVNNAGVAAKGDNFGLEEVKWTNQTNFYGTIEITEKLLPLLAEKGKVVTLGSMVGPMTHKRISNQELKKRWSKAGITKDQVVNLVKEFQQGVADGNFQQKGWPKWGYGVSKLGINTWTSTLANHEEVVKKNIQVYVCCPGYVKTDMTSQKGKLSIEEGIRTPMFLVNLPFEVNKEFQGQFFQEEKLSSTFSSE